MRESRLRRVAVVAATMCVLGGGAASGQVTQEEWRKGTALAVFGGAATVDGSSDALIGGTASWEMFPRFTVEGAGFWTAGGDRDAFTALVGPRVNLLTPRPVVPFVAAGVGLHRSTVDAARKLTTDDFAVSVGGGFDIYLRRHLALRPDVRLLMVDAAGGMRRVAMYGIHLAYHFEEHPVTP